MIIFDMVTIAWRHKVVGQISKEAYAMEEGGEAQIVPTVIKYLLNGTFPY